MSAPARIGIENISVFGLPPVAFVELAADLGVQHISTGLTSFDYGVYDRPPFSLRDDPGLRRDMIAAMRGTGISISLGEGLTIRADADVRDYAGDLAIFAELGVRRINSVSMDPDLGRSFDQLAMLADLAAQHGMVSTVELCPALTINSLPLALAAVAHVDRTDFRLLIDTMHLVRSGAGPEDIAAIDPALIDYVQLADAPRTPAMASYFEEAMFQRMVPGEGELGLAALLAVLPADRIYALEVPLRAEAQQGIPLRESLGRCVAAARRLLGEVHPAG